MNNAATLVNRLSAYSSLVGLKASYLRLSGREHLIGEFFRVLDLNAARGCVRIVHVELHEVGETLGEVLVVDRDDVIIL